MITLGLSGSSGSGKTTIAGMFAKFCNAAVFCADMEVNDMYSNDEDIANLVKEYFPDSISEGCVSKKELAKHFFVYSAKWQEFQSLVHKALIKRQRKFMIDSRRAGHDYVILDIPLLFEKGFLKACDFVIHVYVCRMLQYERLAARGMSRKDMEFILSLQATYGKRQNFADFYINTGLSRVAVSSYIRNIVDDIKNMLRYNS